MIYEIFKNFNYSPFLEIILLYLFGFYIDKRISNLILNPIKPPCSYSFKWSFNNFWDDYPDLVAKHAETQFLKKNKSSSDLAVEEIDEKIKKNEINNNEKLSEINEINKLKQGSSILINKMDNTKKWFVNTANYLDFRNYFKSDILKYESEHRRISRALGFLTIENLHDSGEILEKSPMDLAKETYSKLMGFISVLKEGVLAPKNISTSSNIENEKEKKDDFLSKFEKNEFRETLLSFLRVFFFILFNF